MRQQIEQAIRNARLPLNNTVVKILLSTNFDDLLALEADAGLDPQGTIVHWYNIVESMQAYSTDDEYDTPWTLNTVKNTRWAIGVIDAEVKRLGGY